MKTRDFAYDLPKELIAQRPLPARSAGRLLCLDGAGGDVEDRRFRELPELFAAGDLIVFNDTRVIPARLFGAKSTGGKVEVLAERILDNCRMLAHVRASKPLRPGARLRIADASGADAFEAEMIGRRGGLYELRVAADKPLLSLLERYGHVPLPPYIDRADEAADHARYQTVYAQSPGAVAAPTAGLHFDRGTLKALAEKGIEQAYLTLHVGAGTFQPVRAENVEDHRMHPEWVSVRAEVCDAVKTCRARGGRVVAVGTTCVRALESTTLNGELRSFQGETRLFITPGFRFRVVDALITNFHLPGSTLLMLVCAFGGYANVMRAYHHAVEQRYRFYSYGDAMFVKRL